MYKYLVELAILILLRKEKYVHVLIVKETMVVLFPSPLTSERSVVMSPSASAAPYQAFNAILLPEPLTATQEFSLPFNKLIQFAEGSGLLFGF